MKVFISTFIAVFIPTVLCLPPCFGQLESPNIVAVQKTILPIDRSITLGGALQHYRYFKSLEWKDMPFEGRNFVQVTGKFDADRLFATLLGPDYNISGEDRRFTQRHDLKQVEREWRPKISKLGLTLRIMINADGTIELVNAWAGESEAIVYTYYMGDDNLRAIQRMIYRQTMPVFILDGFKRPTDMLR